MSKRGPIYKGKNGKSFFEYTSWCHRYKYVDVDGKIKSAKKKGYKTEEESDKAYDVHLKEFEEQLQQLKKVPDKDITFKNYLTYWLEDIYSSQVKLSTETVCAYLIYNLIFPNVDYDVKLNLVTTTYLDDIILKISKTVEYGAYATRNLLIRIFKEAIKDKIITQNVALNTKFYAKEKPKIKILNIKQLKSFLVAVKNSKWYLEILLALFCGLRKGEIMALKFSDFNIEQKTLRIERQLVRKGNRIRNTLQIVDNSLIECYPKTSNSVRTIKVPDLILEELNNRREIVEINKRLLKDKYIDNDYISCQENGKGHYLSSLNFYLSKVCNDLCLPHITVHSLRHMCATILLENASTSVGENLAKISAFLGHRSIHTTFKYYCEVMDDNNKILSFMNSFLLETSNV